MPDSLAVEIVDGGHAFSYSVVFTRVDNGYTLTLRTFSGAQESNRRQGVIRPGDAAKLAAWLTCAPQAAKQPRSATKTTTTSRKTV